MLFSLTLPLLFLAVDFQVTVEPFDFQNESLPQTFFSSISHLESDGTLLGISDSANPSVVFINQAGTFVKAVGQEGPGPEEMGRGIFTFSFAGDLVWVVGERLDRVHLFSKGHHELAFARDRRYPVLSTTSTNNMVFDEDHLVLPKPIGSQHLAVAYDYGGAKMLEFGTPPEVPAELKAANPWIFDSLWTRDEMNWYCLLKHQPILIRFDRAFNEEARFKIAGPEIDKREKQAWEHAATQGAVGPQTRKFKAAAPYFSDFKIFDGELFMMTDGVLYQVDPRDGRVLSRTLFRGEGPEFASLAPGQTIAMFFFAFFNDGTIAMAHPAMPWDHDLWTAKLPFLDSNSRKKLAQN